jgi:transcriptional regulator with XRE-family HTH domain
MNDIHKKIKAVRAIRNLNQADVAKDGLFSLKTYQRIESGEKDPTESEINRIA